MPILRSLLLQRRQLFLGSAIAITGYFLGRRAMAWGEEQPKPKPRPSAPAARSASPVERRIALTVNGETTALEVDTRTSLLDALREQLGLTGAKKGCDHGQCGACTVHVEGKRVLSCLTLAVATDGQKITTIEGLAAPGGELHPMQAAFIAHDAFQCGYCTPGQIMSAVACVEEGHADSADEIREYMSGNLCRCAAYPNIVAAIQQAKPKMERA